MGVSGVGLAASIPDSWVMQPLPLRIDWCVFNRSSLQTYSRSIQDSKIAEYGTSFWRFSPAGSSHAIMVGDHHS